MRLSIRRRDFIVFDGFLPRAQFDRLNRYFRLEATLERVPTGPGHAWNINDGRPLSSRSILFEIGRSGAVKRPRQADGAAYSTYPSGSAIDLLIPKVVAQLGRYRYLIGALGSDWRSASATGFAYPRRTSLEWHHDGIRYTGAYVFYAHRSWEAAWGGELLIEDRRGAGAGAFITPTPNRLVVLRGGTRHKIAKVSLLAGEHVRYSVAGFFRREGMPETA